MSEYIMINTITIQSDVVKKKHCKCCSWVLFWVCLDYFTIPCIKYIILFERCSLFYFLMYVVHAYFLYSVALDCYRRFFLAPSLLLLKLYQPKRKTKSPMVTVSDTTFGTVTAVQPKAVVEEPVEKMGFKHVQETTLANICK